MDTIHLPDRRILFTPGPLTTSAAVKSSLICEDRSPRDPRFMSILKDIRCRIARIVGPTPAYQSVLLSSSGTGSVESMLLAAARTGHPLLILNNGAYGQRMVDIAEAHGIAYSVVNHSPLHPIDLDQLHDLLLQNEQTWAAIAVVHHETTTGLLNDIAGLGNLCKQFQIPFIVDAMSSFAATQINMQEMNIHLLATSSNKNLQGMPGVGIVVIDTVYALQLLNHPKNAFYLDCLAEWQAQEQSGQARFTLPVQIIQSLATALDEFEQEGRDKRLGRYQNNWEILTRELTRLGFSFLLADNIQSQLIVSVLEPDHPALKFSAINSYMSQLGIDIYPGKLPGYRYFRLCTVGDLYAKDMHRFIAAIETYMHQHQLLSEAI